MPGAEPPPTGESGSNAVPVPSSELPSEVITCLQNARFLHLATCTSNEPHVSLMNYTYLAPNTRPISAADSASQLPPGPTIIMTSNPSSKKTTNLLSNPNVSLLVHDWVSSRPPNMTTDISGGGGSLGGGISSGRREHSPAGRAHSTLATMLMQMNSAAVSSISATINGRAHVLDPGSPDERWCKEQHLANNTFGHDLIAAQRQRVQVPPGEIGDGGRVSYIEDEDVRVVVVEIRDGRISDWKGGVKDWVITASGAEGADLVNGA